MTRLTRYPPVVCERAVYVSVVNRVELPQPTQTTLKREASSTRSPAHMRC